MTRQVARLVRGGDSEPPAARCSQCIFASNNDRQDPRQNRITWMQTDGKTIVRVYASAIRRPIGKSVLERADEAVRRERRPGPAGQPAALAHRAADRADRAAVHDARDADRLRARPRARCRCSRSRCPTAGRKGNLALLAAPVLVGARLDAPVRHARLRALQQTGRAEVQFTDTGLFIVRSVAMKAETRTSARVGLKLFEEAINLSPVARAALALPGDDRHRLDHLCKGKTAFPSPRGRRKR